MNVIIRAAGSLLAAIGLGIVVFGLLAIADPQGAQLANDADPFGAPPTGVQLALRLVVGLALCALGIRLALRRSKPKSRSCIP